MKSASAAALAVIATGTYAKAELYEFDVYIPNQVTLRFTNWDTALTVGGLVYSTGLTFKRDTVKQSVGLNADTFDVTIGNDAEATTLITVGTIPFITAIQRGYLDSCQARFYKLFMATPGDTSAGSVLWFAGRVANVEGGRISVKVTIESNVALLNIQMPRNLIQVGCAHSLFDSGCTLVKSNYLTAGTVATSVANNVYQFGYAGLAAAVGYYNLGTIQWTSGGNQGLTSTVKSHVAGLITVNGALPVAPANGDTFNIFPGCDKQQITCKQKFAVDNTLHFRGYPFVPVPETLYDGGTFNPTIITNDGATGTSINGSATNAAKSAPGSYVP